VNRKPPQILGRAGTSWEVMLGRRRTSLVRHLLNKDETEFLLWLQILWFVNIVLTKKRRCISLTVPVSYKSKNVESSRSQPKKGEDDTFDQDSGLETNKDWKLARIQL
jgi:hypothetical protein